MKALIDGLLSPLGVDGSREIRTRVFDFRADRPVACEPQTVGPQAILVFDGVFLHVPDLRSYWDFTVFLQVPFGTTVERAAKRDQHVFGSEGAVRARYARRYIPGQELYLAECQPQDRASVVVDNTDFKRPVLLREEERARAPRPRVN